MQAPEPKLLKKDIFGGTYLVPGDAGATIRRDASEAAFAVRWVARWLLSREARALAVLDGIEGVPELLHVGRESLLRSYIDGAAMHRGKPDRSEYFRAASALLRKLHRRGVVHNDLAKEPNLLVMTDGNPAIIDYQLSWAARRRGRLFRILAREDIRHLLKHKRTYCPAQLTKREKQILENPSVLSRIFMSTVKPVYLFVTRRILGWRDREGAGDRF
ncbi:MAG: putative Ser/Thr protein kinase [Woeseiaceae bacterium]